MSSFLGRTQAASGPSGGSLSSNAIVFRSKLEQRKVDPLSKLERSLAATINQFVVVARDSTRCFDILLQSWTSADERY